KNSNGLISEGIVDAYSGKILDVVQMTSLGVDEKNYEVERVSSFLQSTLDMEKQLYKFVLFKYGVGESDRFLWIIHHSIIDGYSLPIFFDELFSRYLSMVANIIYISKPKTNSLAEWAEYLYEYVNSPEVEEDIEYWASLS